MTSKKDILVYSFSGLVMLTLIIVSGTRNASRKVDAIDVSIAQEDGNFFTDEIEVMSLITLQSSDFIVGTEVDELSPKMLEQRVEENPFIKDAQVFRDLKGELMVRVKQSKPIARLLLEGKDRYIDADGSILPVTARHTARVPLVDSPFAFEELENLQDTNFGKKIYALLQFIGEDEFWSAQIAQVNVLADGDIELLPQVTKQRVMIGAPEDLAAKFDKLMVFYKEILPNKGWNTYSLVNLKYENQIICE